MSDAAGGPAKLVVGVGASAGGLEAISALLRDLEPQAPLGLVVLMHLDPAHGSNLVELLARQTSLKVLPATEGAEIKSGEIHVITPTSDLRLSGGRLQLLPRSSSPHLPIDDFFDSLARDRGTQAAGVVLSGTGLDGAAGVCAVRRWGGTTFAQDQSAQYEGMPQAAIATGCVDLVGSPSAIAARLMQRAAGGPADGDEGSLRRVFTLLRRGSGIDFSSYKPSTIRRRIQRRAAAGHHLSIAAYLESLGTDAAEVSALAADLLIHVTNFFRDPSVFEALATRVLPALLASKRPDEPVRIWVPGCSTGEEVYSLVMTVSEQAAELGLDLPLRVFGTDLSESAIERARSGQYPASIERDVSPARLERYFLRTETGYQIRKDLRDACIFARQDITRDPPFSNIDLLSCRNLMIYLSAALQHRVIPLFHYALRSGGVLLLGSSESTGNHPGFEAADLSHRIYRRTASAANTDLAAYDTPRWPTPPPPVRLPPSAINALDVQREADRVVLELHAPPGVVVKDDLTVVQFRGQTGPFLEPIPGTASLDLLRLAREDLRVDLRSALDQARRRNAPVRAQLRTLRAGEPERLIALQVIPLVPPLVSERHFVILFDEKDQAPGAPPEPVRRIEDQEQRQVEDALREELSSTRVYLQSVIEQLEAGNEELRAANEEGVSSNEELQSTNEELQAAKEELQATNEELSTVNDEMVQRNLEANQVNDDLNNVLNSAGLAILILGRDSRIRRFTAPAARLLNLIATDVGRPISNVKSNLRGTELMPLVTEVLEQLTVREQLVVDVTDHWYQLRVRPYLTTDQRVDGTVVTIVDVDAIQRAKTLLTEARDYSEAIVETVREPLLVLDEDSQVRTANRAFYQTFAGSLPAQLEGKAIDQLGEPRWASADFLATLKKLRESPPGEARVDDRVTEFGGLTTRFSGRALVRAGQAPWLLLAFEDVSAQMKLDAAMRRSERTLREMLHAASEAILFADARGLITFANPMAARIFGYEVAELPGLALAALVPGVLPLSPARPRELEARRKDGTRFPVEVGTSELVTEEGQSLVAFVSDITERREHELRTANDRELMQGMAFDATLGEERQRRSLAVALHDNVGQTLALALLRLKGIRQGSDGHPSDGQKHGAGPRRGQPDGDGHGSSWQGTGERAVSEAVALIEKAITDTRELTFELSPPVLHDLGLPAALSWLADQFEAQHHFTLTVRSTGPGIKLEDGAAGVLFRSIRELVMNVVKHAKVPEATVTVGTEGPLLTVTVEDHGQGFDGTQLNARGSAAGFGLISVREQINRLGGRFEATSSPEGGTLILLAIPVASRIGRGQDE